MRAAMRVAAPADKRFRRVRVTPGRRRPWRMPWPSLVRLALVIVVAGYGVYHVAWLVLSAEALTVTRIVVAGNTRMSRGEVVALLEGLRGESMLTSSLEGWRERLLSSPWVADAVLRRIFPGTVSVLISEREPIGIGRLGEHLYLIDHQGAIIDEFGPNYSEFDLPLIDGLAAGQRAGALLVDEGRALLATRLLSDLQRRPDLAKLVSQIDVTDARDAAVILKGDTALVRMGDDRFVDRLQSYLDLAPALRERVDDIDYVDLRFDERVYVRPRAAGRATRKATVPRTPSSRAPKRSLKDRR